MQETPRLNPVGRPPASNSAETRKRIIHAARDVFRTVGYAGATHMAIATRAELTRPSVNYHFASKRSLFDLVVATNAEVLDEALRRAAAESSLTEQLHAFVTSMCLDAEVHAATAFLSVAEMERQRHPELRGDDDVPAGLQPFLRDAVASALERNELTADADVAAVADTLHAVLTGLALYGDPEIGGHRSQNRIETMMLLLTGSLFTDANRADEASSRVA